jgi:hypothetical protein
LPTRWQIPFEADFLLDPATLPYRSGFTTRNVASITGNDNDPVAAWNDLSANALHLVQATAGNKPTFKTNRTPNGLPAVYFASPRFLSCPAWFTATTNSAFTLFIAYKVVGTPAFGLMGDASNAWYIQTRYEPSPYNYLDYVGFGGTNFKDGAGGTMAPKIYAPVPASAWDVVAFRGGGTSRSMFVKGNNDEHFTIDGFANTLNGQALQMGKGGSNYWAGDVAECWLFDSELTDAQVYAIVNFLRNAIGLPTFTNGIVVGIGNSTTYGSGSTDHKSWFAQLAANFHASGAGLWFRNQGISGCTDDDMNLDAQLNADPYYRPGLTNIELWWSGHNDNVHDGWSNVEIQMTLNQVDRHLIGWKVLALTTDSYQNDADKLECRDIVNAYFAANPLEAGDTLVPHGLVYTGPAVGDYYDVVHPSDQGHAKIYNALIAPLQALIA